MSWISAPVTCAIPQSAYSPMKLLASGALVSYLNILLLNPARLRGIEPVDGSLFSSDGAALANVAFVTAAGVELLSGIPGPVLHDAPL